MRILFLVFGVLFGITGGAAAQTVGGNYSVAGTNFDGTRYTGTVQIRFLSDSTCTITWQVGTTAQGVCMRAEGVVSAAYRFDQGGKIGLVTYFVQPDGTLNGRWTITGANGVGTEILSPVH